MAEENKKGFKPFKGQQREAKKKNGLVIEGIQVTPEQEAYCRARAMGMDMKEAMSAAGLKQMLKTVKNWEIKNGAVVKRIAELTMAASRNAIMKNGLDRSWVIERLMKVVDRCMQAEPVKDRDGNETGEYKFDSSGANKALQLLGAELGMFTPKTEKPGDEYANLSDDDLARLARELAAQTGIIENHAGTQAPARSEQIIEVQALPKAD